MAYLAWLCAAQAAAGSWPNEKAAVNAIRAIIFHIPESISENRRASPEKTRLAPSRGFILEGMAPVTETEELQLADVGGSGPPNLGPGDYGGGGDGDGGSPDPRYVPGAGLLAMRLVLVSITTLFVTVGIAYYERAQSS